MLACGCSAYENSFPKKYVSSKKYEITEKSQCPNIDGVYYSLGKSSSTFGERYENPLLDYGLIDHPSAKNKIKIVADPNGSGISYLVYNEQKKLIFSKKINKTYICRDGWMIFQLHSAGGSGEIGSYSKNKTITKKTISSDNSTLIINIFSETMRKTFFLIKKKSISEVEYRYKKVEGTY